MDITSAALGSIGMSANAVQQQAAISMAKKAMELTENQMTDIIESLEVANPTSSFGHSLDMYI